MDLAEYVEQIRSSYLAYFQKSYEQLIKADIPIAVEVPVELSTGRPYTIDFIQMHTDGRRSVVEVAPPRSHQPQSFTSIYRTLSLSFNTAEWDAMRITTSGCTLDENALQSWQTRWIDIDGVRQNKDGHFGGVIHSLVSDKTQIHVDLGTAKTDAFFALLDVLVTSGCSNAVLGSDRE